MDTKALFKLSYGLYIVGSCRDGQVNAQTANTVFQISSDPITVGISLNKKNLTHDFVLASKVFTVNVLAADASLDLIGNFGFQSGREVNKFAALNYQLGANEAPILCDNICGYLEGKVVSSLDCGTHTIFVGEITQAVSSQQQPMTYSQYRELKNAPKTGTATYKCSICGYEYCDDLPFEDLPADFVCPVCGVSKSMFKKL